MSSQQLITDMTTVSTNGPSTVTAANAIAAAGPIEDYVGNVKQCILKFQEVKTLATLLINNTDPTSDSANLALLVGITGSLT